MYQELLEALAEGRAYTLGSLIPPYQLRGSLIEQFPVVVHFPKTTVEQLRNEACPFPLNSPI